MIAEIMAPMMIKRGLKGTRFSRVEPKFLTGLDGVGWYVHMPFCRHLCPYCSFRSLHYSPDKVKPYIDAVKREISIYRDKLGKIKTGDIYFGGGTPSLTWQGVIELVEFIRERLDIGGEVGMEANPEDIDEEMCTSLRQAGVAKISMGVQSFDNETLRNMQRHYNARQVFKAIEILLDKGFYVSIDLLYGLPHQQVSGLLRDMKIAAGTGVHQISAYPLMLFPYTRWYRDVEKGIITVPPARIEKKLFYTVSDYLTANGYRQTSCWDFTISEKSGMQYVTCARDENIGVGLSAYTKIGELFYVNTFSLKEYINGVKRNLPIATGMTMPSERVMRRWFMMGLYRLKVEKDEFENRFGVRMEKALGRFLFMLKLMNIIRETPDSVELTRNGMYWASLMTKTSMLTFPGRYYQECLRHAWPGDFEM
ncbi:MAG: coproporphyrinogen-III oxidase family protein [Chloroflexota bacterium]